MKYVITCDLTPDEVEVLRAAVATNHYTYQQRLLRKLLSSAVPVEDKTYIPQRLNVFLASLKQLPHDAEVCLDDTNHSPAGWSYDREHNRVLLHK